MINLKKLNVLFILTLSFSCFGQDANYILALSKGEQKLVVYDYNSLDSITSVDVGEDPHEIVTNTDGTKAYISKPLMKEDGHEIAMVDLETFQTVSYIDTKPFLIPHGMVYLNEQLWMTAQGSKAVVVYDIEKKEFSEVFGTGQNFTHLLHVSEDGKLFYTTNVESGTLSIYEKNEIPPYMPPTGILPPNAKPRIEWRQTLVDVGIGAEGFDVSSDGKELWTARPDGKIIIVDLVKKKVKAKINTKVEGLHRLKFTPDGKSVCIVSVKTGDLLYYNYDTHKLEKRVNIGRGAGIYMDVKSNRMFISCTPENYIVIIDLETREEVKRIAIGRPDGITSI